MAQWTPENMLKPALARGELHCVGATTLDEYRQYIEKDAALERRFQKVFVAEPSVEDTIAILRGLKERYELHHHVQITDPAIVAAATLSHRYIADRQLPDKAIDLIDEAASSIRMQIDSKPEELDRLDRRIIQLKLEQQALMKESDEASKKRLDMLNEELSDKERQYSELEEGVESREGIAFWVRRPLKRNWNRRKSLLNRLAVWGTWRGCLNCNTAKSRNWKSNWKPQRSSKAKLCVCCVIK
ncbi:protein disaggregation chaperone [Escherichia coli]|uniref:Protein disaggregation chaperone n=1 Tax=Escherichia coli TaxID=562 RepID=A0A2X1KAL9_ECOLX|nr:protein disaggregation chaperone [Escherichia coli]